VKFEIQLPLSKNKMNELFNFRSSVIYCSCFIVIFFSYTKEEGRVPRNQTFKNQIHFALSLLVVLSPLSLILVSIL
jgi:hypothetical protein